MGLALVISVLAAAPATFTEKVTGVTITAPAYAEPCVILPRVPFDAAACEPATEDMIGTLRDQLSGLEAPAWGAMGIGHGAGAVSMISMPFKGASLLSDDALDKQIGLLTAPLGCTVESFGLHRFKIVQYPRGRGARYVCRAVPDASSRGMPLQIGVLFPSQDTLLGVNFQFSGPGPEADAFEAEMMATLDAPRSLTATSFGDISPYVRGAETGFALGRALKATLVVAAIAWILRKIFRSMKT